MRIVMLAAMTILGMSCLGQTGHAQGPVIILDSDMDAVSTGDREKIIRAVTRQFDLTDEHSPYLKAKVKIEAPTGGHPYQLTVFILYNKIYLFETYRLTLDANFDVVESIKENSQ